MCERACVLSTHHIDVGGVGLHVVRHAGGFHELIELVHWFGCHGERRHASESFVDGQPALKYCGAQRDSKSEFSQPSSYDTPAGSSVFFSFLPKKL